jgi:hypothetical protein
MLKYELIEAMANRAVSGNTNPHAEKSILQKNLIKILLDFGLEVAKAADREKEGK